MNHGIIMQFKSTAHKTCDACKATRNITLQNQDLFEGSSKHQHIRSLPLVTSSIPTSLPTGCVRPDGVACGAFPEQSW